MIYFNKKRYETLTLRQKQQTKLSPRKTASGAEMEPSHSVGPGNTSFHRLRALVKRGYQPDFSGKRSQGGLAGLDFVHANRAIEDAPPRLTLWSDGTLATGTLLWPKQYVASEDGPPDWQRVIFADEPERFDAFAKGVPRPSLKDRYMSSAIFEGQVFMGRLIFGSLLCVVVASAVKIGTYFV